MCRGACDALSDAVLVAIDTPLHPRPCYQLGQVPTTSVLPIVAIAFCYDLKLTRNVPITLTNDD